MHSSAFSAPECCFFEFWPNIKEHSLKLSNYIPWNNNAHKWSIPLDKSPVNGWNDAIDGPESEESCPRIMELLAVDILSCKRVKNCSMNLASLQLQ